MGRWWGALLIGWVLVWRAALPVQAAEHVVRAVLFYLSTCDHCRQVITHDLAPLLDQYGPQLEIVGVDIDQPAGRELYQVAMQHFNIPEAQRGVPTLIVGNVVLIDASRISRQFPDLIERYLPLGCVGWPDIPGLTAALATQPALMRLGASTSPCATVAGCDLVAQTAPPDTLSVRLVHDSLGSALACAGLLGLVCGVARVTRRHRVAAKSWPAVLLAVLALAASVYLAAVETTQSTCICDVARYSEDAHWFNLLPIGLLGVIGYVLIAMAYRLSRCTPGHLLDLARQALFGILLAVYLMLMEPLTFGPRYVWCLTATVTVTAVLWLVATPDQSARPKQHAVSTLKTILHFPTTLP
jgi:glutaredoxin